MRNIRQVHVLLSLLVVAACMAWAGAVSAKEPGSGVPASTLVGKKVLLVHSYHREHPWVANVEAGVRTALEGAGLRIESLYMDTKRNPGEMFRLEAGRRARQVVERFRPEVIIASDDNAQEVFARQYAGVPGAPQVVFCAVNRDPGYYGYPAVNVAGIEERIFFARSVAFLQKLVPGIRSMLVMSDNSPSSRAAMEEMQAQPVVLDRIVWKNCRDISEWKKTLRTGQEDVDAVALLNYHVLTDGKGSQLAPEEVLAWTAGNLTRPSIGFHVFTIADGALCGIAQSGFEHGFRSGGMALDLLRGRSAREIGIRSDLQGVAMINRKAAQRVGVSIPAEVELLADGVIE